MSNPGTNADDELRLEIEREKIQEVFYGKAKASGVPIEFLDFVVDWIIKDRKKYLPKPSEEPLREQVLNTLDAYRMENNERGMGMLDVEPFTDRIMLAIKAHDQAKASSLKAAIKELPGASGTGYVSVTKVLDLLKEEI
jgi:hypothetical protein